MSKGNYHRFYGLLQQLDCPDKEDQKESLVWSYTDGRTTHLSEMTSKEYDEMCRSLEERTGWRAELRKKRSLCLESLQVKLRAIIRKGGLRPPKEPGRGVGQTIVISSTSAMGTMGES